MRATGRFHHLDEHAAHFPRTADDHRPVVRTGARFTEDFHPLLQLGLDGLSVGDFEAEVMLRAGRIILERRRGRRFFDRCSTNSI